MGFRCVFVGGFSIHGSKDLSQYLLRSDLPGIVIIDLQYGANDAKTPLPQPCEELQVGGLAGLV